jgi:hypothetical protein
MRKKICRSESWVSLQGLTFDRIEEIFFVGCHGLFSLNFMNFMNFTSFHLIPRSFVKNNFISFHFTSLVEE